MRPFQSFFKNKENNVFKDGIGVKGLIIMVIILSIMVFIMIIMVIITEPS